MSVRSLTLRTATAGETRALGAALAAVAGPGDRIALLGPLGAGKTQLAKGFGAGLGVTDEITSPSFTLMAEHTTGRLPLFHLDLYRLAGTEDALAGGMLDEREDAGVTLTEWADRLDAALEGERLVVRITHAPGETRHITLEAAPGRYARYLEAAQRWSVAAGAGGSTGVPGSVAPAGSPDDGRGA